MILRRFMQHVKEQNWFAVGLDVIVVIVGIFLGLQVTAWNEARQNDQSAIEVIEDLRIEFDAIEEISESAMTNYAGIISDLEILVKSMNEGVLMPENEEAVLRTMKYGDIFYDPAPLSSTFRDLVGSGRLALIRDKELRLALASYDQSHSIVKDSDLNINIILGYYGDAYKRHTRLDPNYTIPQTEIANFEDVPFPGVASFDFDAMQNDPEFRVAAEQLMRMQIIRYGNNKLAHDRILHVQGLLARNMKSIQ